MKGLWNWFTDTLRYYGLWGKNATILFLGLDNAGKTTLMHMMHNGRLVQHTPTRNPTSESMTMDRLTFRAVDLGGHKEARRLWKDYFIAVDAIVYIVDVADPGRLEESKAEFQTLLVDENLSSTPILVLGNKVDMDGALSEPLFRDAFGLYETSGKEASSLPPHIRPMEVFMCSIVERAGFGDGFKWLSHYV